MNISQDHSSQKIFSQDTRPLEDYFKEKGLNKICKFMKVFKQCANNVNTLQEKECLKIQIENTEQFAIKNHGQTLLSAVIRESPDFAIEYMEFFKSSVNLKKLSQFPPIRCLRKWTSGLSKSAY